MKTQRCNTAGNLGGSNPRSNGRILQGSKQVINHIQTIIRNNNGSINTFEAKGDQSIDDFNVIGGTRMAGPKTNNFFTTEAKDIQKTSAISGTGFPITIARPPRLHTATGTNRIKSTFFIGF